MPGKNKATVALAVQIENQQSVDQWLENLSADRTTKLKVEVDKTGITELGKLVDSLTTLSSTKIDLSGLGAAIKQVAQVSGGLANMQQMAGQTATAMQSVTASASTIGSTVAKQVALAGKELTKLHRSLSAKLTNASNAHKRQSTLTGNYEQIYQSEMQRLRANAKTVNTIVDSDNLVRQIQNLEALTNALSELQKRDITPVNNLDELQQQLTQLREFEYIPQSVAVGLDKLQESLRNIDGTSLAELYTAQLDLTGFESQITSQLDAVMDKAASIISATRERISDGVNATDMQLRTEQLDKFAEAWKASYQVISGSSDSLSSKMAQMNSLIAQLEQYTTLLTKVNNVSPDAVTKAYVEIDKANVAASGLGQSLDAVYARLQTHLHGQNSLSDMLGALQAENELEQLSSSIDYFTVRYQRMLKTQQQFQNALDSGLFGARDSQSYKDAARSIELLGDAIHSLTAESDGAAWLNADAMIATLRRVQTEMRGVLNDKALGTRKTALLGDIDAWAQDSATAVGYVSDKLEELKQRIQDADAQQFSSLRKEFNQLKAEAEGLASEPAFEFDKQNFSNQIEMWSQRYPAAARVYAAELDDIKQKLQDVDSQGFTNLQKQFSNITQQASLFGMATQSLSSAWQNLKDDFSAAAIILSLGSAIEQSFSQALDTLKDVDTYLTEISKVSDMTSAELSALSTEAFDAASKYGENVTTYLEGIQEWSRAGFGDTASDLAELSVLAKSAGDMTSEMATSYLIATDAAYQLGGDVAALNAILDGQNQITNRNAVSMEELADATRIAGAQAATSGISIDKFSAAVGTMQAVTNQGGATAGRAFRTILMNLQQISGTTDDGEVLDSTSFNKVEKALHAIGVATSEVKDGILVLRDPMEVLRETAEVVSTLADDSIEKANVLSSLGGKYRATQLAALLDNWDLYEQMLSDYNDNSLGSAATEAAKTAASWEGSLARLSNTFTEFVSEFVKADTVITTINLITDAIEKLGNIISGFTGFDNLAGVTTFIATFKLLGTTLKGIPLLGSKTKGTSIGAIFDKLRQDIQKTESEAQTLPQAFNGIVAAFRNATEAARAAGGAVNLLFSAVRSLATMAVSMVISAVVSGVYEQIQAKVEEAERIAEEAEQAYSNYTSAQDNIDSRRESVEAVRDEYIELSKGVNASGENLTLTNDEYDRYISLSNQLAELLPSTVDSWDANGNAILKVAGNVDALNQALDTTLQTMTEVADAELIQSADATLQDARNSYNQLMYDRDWPSASVVKYQSELNTNRVQITPELWSAVVRAIETYFTQYTGDLSVVDADELENAIIDALPDDMQIYGTDTNLIPQVLSRLGARRSFEGYYDASAISDGLSEARSELTLWEEDMRRVDQRTRESLLAYANQAKGYANLTGDAYEMMVEYISQMPLDFTRLDSFTGAAASAWAQELVNAANTVEGVAGAAMNNLDDLEAQFARGEITIGEYRAAVQETVRQLDSLAADTDVEAAAEMATNFGQNIVDGFADYQRQLNAVSMAIQGETAEEWSWIDSLTSDELEFAYSIVPNDDSSMTLEEFQAEYDRMRQLDKSSVTFSIGVYTEDLNTAQDKLEAINDLVSKLHSGALTPEDILSFASDNPEFGDILGYVDDSTIDTSGLTNYLTGLYSTVIDNVRSQVQSELDYMSQDNADRPIAEAFMAMLDNMSTMPKATSEDVESAVSGYVDARIAAIRGAIEYSVGHIDADGAWTEGVSDEVAASIESTLGNINIDTSKFMDAGLLSDISWQQQIAGGLQAYFDSYIQSLTSGSERASEAMDEEIAALAQEYYDTFTSRLDTFNEAIQARAEGTLDAEQLLDFGQIFSTDLAAQLESGDFDALNQWLQTELAQGALVFQALGEQAGEAAPKVEAFLAAYSSIGTNTQTATEIANITSQIAELNQVLEDEQAALDSRTSRGDVATVQDYSSLIDKSRQIAALNEMALAAYNETLASAEEGSPAYNATMESIRECTEAIDDAKTAQYEWNQAIVDTFGYSGASATFTELGSIMQDVYNRSYGGQVTADTAMNLAQWLQSVGVSPADFISVDKGGITVDNAGVRQLAEDTVQAYINDLKAQLDKASGEERAQLELSLQLMIDAQAEITSSTSVLAELQGGYNSLNEQLDLISQAYTEQASATGLSIDTYRALIDLNADYANALEYSGGMMRLNEDLMRDYTDEARKQILADTTLAKLQAAQQYEENAKRIEELVGAYYSVEDAYMRLGDAGRAELLGLLQQNSQLSSTIDSYNLLASSLDSATFAYQNWLNAQDGPSPDDWFYAGQTAYQQYVDGLESGKIGRGTEYDYATQLLFAGGDPTEEGRKFVQRYFDGEKDELKRMQTFAEDLVDWGYLDKEGDDYIVSDFIDLDALSQQTGLTEYALRSLFQNLESYGFEFDWDDWLISGTDGFESEYLSRIQTFVDAAQRQIERLNTKVTLTADEQIQLDTLQGFVDSYDTLEMTVDLDSEDAQSELDTLIEQGENLVTEGTLTLDADTSTDTSTVETQIANLQTMVDGIQSQLEQLVVQIATSDAEMALNTLTRLIYDLVMRVNALATMTVGDLGAGRASSAANELSAMLRNVASQVINLSSMSIGTLGTNAVTESLRTILNLLSRINSFQIADKTFTVRSIEVGGTASARGTNNAKAGTTLVGELKPEILVRDGQWYLVGKDGAEFVNLKRGDIVIDGDNTERLLRGSRGARGTAMAQGGQAMATGGQAMAGGSLLSGIFSGIKNTLTNVVKNVTNAVKKVTSAASKSGISSGKGSFNSGSSGSSSKKSSSSGSSSKKSSSSGSSSKGSSSSGSSSSSSSSSATSSADEAFDWIEVRLDRLTKQIDDLVAEAEEQISYLAKNDELSKALDIVNEKIEDAKKGYEEYLEAAKNAAKESGLSEELQKKVQLGDISIEDYDDATREAIIEYQTWYEKALELESALYDLNEQQRELASQKLDNIITHYERLNDIIEQQQDLVREQIELDNLRGEAVSENAYKQLIAAEQIQIANLKASMAATQAELSSAMSSGVIAEGSAEWYDYTAKINDMSTAILQSEQAIAEYEQSIVDSRIAQLNYAVEQADIAQDMLEDEASLRREQGRVVDESLYQTQVQQNLRQMQAQQALLDEYNEQFRQVEYGSEKYYELSKNISDVASTMRQLQITQTQLNREIAEMQVSRYADALEILEGQQALTEGMMDLHEAQGEALTDKEYVALIKHGDEQISNLQAQRSEYLKLLGMVEVGSERWQEYKTALLDIDDEILSIKTAQEEWNDAIIDLRIDALEKQKEELEAQNDAYERRIALEKALQELDRARAQRNIQVYREGIGFVWEADQDAIRDAEEELAEQQHEETLAKIDEAIDALEDYKDVNNLYDYLANRIGRGTAADALSSVDDLLLSTTISSALETSALSIADKISSILVQPTMAQTYNSAPITIEKIELHGVQDVDTLADAIVRELPTRITQKLMA